MSILGPIFLVKQIPLFSMIYAAIILVVFSNVINQKIVFPFSDYLHQTIKHMFRKSKLLTESGKETMNNIISSILVTFVFIGYCYFTGFLLSYYIIEPIMLRLREYILIVLLILFFLVTKAVTSKYYRRIFFGY